MTMFPLKFAVLSLLLLWQTTPHPTATPEHLRYQRPIAFPAGHAPQACAVLDAEVFTHAAPSLKDLRVYSGTTGGTLTEVPYAITLSEPAQQDIEDARILNLGMRSGHIVFDLEMPPRPYTSVALDLAAKDFIATAEVAGTQTADVTNPTRLGTFTLFDLSGQHLARSTTLPLPESSFPYLHIELTLASAPGAAGSASTLNRPEIVRAATIPPSREAQTIYTTVQQTSDLKQRGNESVATFQVPSRVPVERIALVLASGYKGSFSRPVRIEANVNPASDLSSADDTTPASESTGGTILSVHQSEAGRPISYESLAIPTAIGSNMQHPATLEVAIENGDDPPLPVAGVQLQMRQRRICFDSAALTGAPLSLFYGDAVLEAPVYDYAKLFQPSADPLPAQLGPETLNPSFSRRAESRPFTERHPELLWVVLLAVVCALALTAFRSAKKLPR